MVLTTCSLWGVKLMRMVCDELGARCRRLLSITNGPLVSRQDARNWSLLRH